MDNDCIIFNGIILFNINKATPYNLYSISTVKLYNVTLFDYFVPMIIILNNLELNFKNTAFSNILTVALANIFLIIFSFSVFSGNYLYSIHSKFLSFFFARGYRLG